MRLSKRSPARRNSLALLDVHGATVQYHPEAGPGPHDSVHLFDRFVSEISAARAAA